MPISRSCRVTAGEYSDGLLAVKIIILGAGQVGRTAAYHLSREEANDVTVIDHNEEILRDLQDRLDIRTVNGNGSSPRILEAAGIASTDILVALTNSDEVNMLACQVAWTLYRTPKKIARVRSADYTERDRLFGANPRAGGRSPGGASLEPPARTYPVRGCASRRHLSRGQEYQARRHHRHRRRR